MEPDIAHLLLDQDSAVPSEWRGLDQFSITRLETTCGLGSEIRKWSCVPAFLVSVPIRSLAKEKYRLWIDEKLVQTASVRPFQSNVVDFASGPACWAGDAFDFVHFHLPRASFDELASELGYDRPGAIRPSILGDDAVIARSTRRILPSLDDSVAPITLALDELEVLLCAHLLRRYSAVRRPRAGGVGRLAPWQRRRVEELLMTNLDGNARLGELARECELPTGYFARAFRVSFGTTCHEWLARRRIECAKELLSGRWASVAESSFGDRARVAPRLHRAVGRPPGTWRRQRGGAVH
jgi:AraC family transcriptional regulator